MTKRAGRGANARGRFARCTVNLVIVAERPMAQATYVVCVLSTAELRPMRTILSLMLGFALLPIGSLPVRAADTKIVLIAGRPSHGPGDHKFHPGTKLLVKGLKDLPGVNPVFVAGAWPESGPVFD